MKRMLRSVRALALFAAVAATAGCAQYGTLGDVLGGVGGLGGDVVGEVRHVDTRRQWIELDTRERDRLRVRYDRRTRVVYRGQEYRVSALEPGDEVALRLERDSRGEYYTDHVSVRRSVSERGRRGGYDPYSNRVQRLEGRVESVDHRRGRFAVRSRHGERILVTLPYGARSREVDRFRRLRRGDNVRVEVVPLNERRAELVRFR